MTLQPIAIAVFLGFVVVTLAITAWASRHARTAANFYAAGGSITPWQNGLAIAGDYLSAASFLGTIALFFTLGVDGMLYAVGAAAGWPIILCLTAERLRDSGRYTFSDVLCRRLSPTPVRSFTALSSLCICGTYLVAQMVGAGALVQTVFAIPYGTAVVLVGVLMMVYVIFGGMVATTWIQIVKASLLIGTTLLMVLLVLERVDFDVLRLIGDAATARGGDGTLLAPGGLLKDPWSALGLACAFLFGPAGMPHVLMRFFTVKDGVGARRSLGYASAIIVVFQVIVVVLGYATIAFIRNDPTYHTAAGSLIGGNNVVAVHLAHLLGGSALFGVVSAVAFATILAVVAGLTLAAASAVSHDLYCNVLHKGRARESAEIRVSRISCLAISVVAVLLGLAFKDQNVGFLATLTLAIAASANFPILMLAMYWPRLTTAGAVAGGMTGLVTSIALVIFSPKVWVDVLGHADAVFPLDYPTALSLPAALLVAVVVSLLGAAPVAETAAARP